MSRPNDENAISSYSKSHSIIVRKASFIDSIADAACTKLILTHGTRYRDTEELRNWRHNPDVQAAARVCLELGQVYDNK